MRKLVIGIATLVAISLGYTLFTENFDGAWTPNSPPTGWRIYHADTTNVADDDWHRDSARAPWTGHPTAFAAILPSATPDATPDSIVSPVIDCRGYKNVTLRCSTDFLPVLPTPYAAQIAYSVDGGATFPYVLETYNTTTGTVCESLVLDQARDQASVVIAWIFDGVTDSIVSWYMDDIQVTGESLYLWDIQAGPIVIPGAAVIRTGLFSPASLFRNLGDTIQYAIPVACSLYDDLGGAVTGWSSSIDSLGTGAWPDTTTVTFTPAYALAAGNYSIRFWCSADSDFNRANDTVGAAFQAVNLYDMATTGIASPGGSTWPGPLTPSARFRNLGDTTQYSVPVACTLYDNVMSVIATWSGTLDSVRVAEELLFPFSPPYAISEGDYFIRFWCSADSDYVRSNDTLGTNFTVSIPSGNLLTETFDSNWTPNSPPPGWRVFHTDPSTWTLNDWHRDSVTPWNLHPSPFAAIWNGPGDGPPDSLISPVINCTGYRNITLTCSTWFSRWSGQPYTAVLVYSVNGGATWSTLRDYRQSSSDVPVQESLELDGAVNRESVIVAWVFDGDMGLINFWFLDDVRVTGEAIPTWDVLCRRINWPNRYTILPGQFTPSARFRNSGLTDQINVPVACSLYDNTMTPLVGWDTVIDTIPALAGEKAAFFDPPYTIGLGDYYIKFWHGADSDYVRSNDTLGRAFRVNLMRELSYDDGSPASYHTWPVGHYGWGTKFDPDTTIPAYIESLKVYLSAPASPAQCRYQLAIFKDDGTGQPGPLHFITPVQTATAGVTGWNSVFMADSGEKLVMPPGSFYVFYLQVGEPLECPRLGCDGGDNPLATYWQYRNGAFVVDSTFGDFMIRAVVNLDPVTLPDHDLRARYVQYPLYDFVQRPFDAPFAPVACAQNSGNMTVTGVSVQCDIIGPGSVLYYSSVVTLDSLTPAQDTVVTFASWQPVLAEQCTVLVKVAMAGGTPDSIPENDEKNFTVDIVKGAHTGTSALNYAWIDSDTTTGPVYNWIDTTGYQGTINLGDEGRSNIPISYSGDFHFPFYDSTYNYIYASANGWLAVGSANPGGTNDSIPRTIPDPADPDRALFVWWDNLAMGPGSNGGDLYWKTEGTAPNRYFVLIWQDVTRVGADTSDRLTFEVILHENGTIEYQYKDVTCGDLMFDNGRYASIGLENPNATDGLNYLYARPPMSTAVHDPGNRLAPGRAIRLYKLIRDAAAIDIVEPDVYSFPGAIVPQVKIQNYGTVFDSIWVTLRIGSGYFSDTVIPGLVAGDSLVLSMPDTWTAAIGSYTATCSTYMVGDVDSSNNIVTKLIMISPWAQRTSIPQGWRRRRVKNAALAFAPSQNKLYAMKGANTNEFWRYDVPTAQWETLAPMPLDPSGYKARDGNDIAYDPEHGAEGRIWAIKGGGRTDFYYYDIASNTWTASKPVVIRDTIPGRPLIYNPPKKGAAITYVPAGHRSPAGSVYCIPGNRSLYFWRYDVASDSWSYAYDNMGRGLSVPVNPLQPVKCKFSTDMVYNNDKIYVLKASGTNEVYDYDMLADSWVTINTVSLFGPTGRKVKSGASMGFVENALFVLKGGNTREFWKYPTAGDSWIRCTDIPFSFVGRRTKVKRGSAMAAAESTMFCLKGSYGYEFWEYGPEGDTVGLLALGSRPGRDGVSARDAELDLSRPFLRVTPNPTSSGLAIVFNLPAPAPVRLHIYDAAGRTVCNLAEGFSSRGRHVLHWNGLSNRQRRVSSGVYFAQLESGSLRLTRKFVVQD